MDWNDEEEVNAEKYRLLREQDEPEELSCVICGTPFLPHMHDGMGECISCSELE